MLLFRSEEHRERWGRSRGIDRGATMSLSTAWALADVWYRDRMSPRWRRRSVDEVTAVFDDLGLRGSFWSLT